MSRDQQVLDLLTQKGGNVEAVATELRLSESYVSRVKKNKGWKAPDPGYSPVTPPMSTALTIVENLLPANIDGVRKLRDSTIEQIQSLVDGGLMPQADLVRLLNVLVKYEIQLREAIKPALSVFNDNRRQTVNLLEVVNQLTAVPHEALRSLAGVASADVIDATGVVEVPDK